MADSNWRKRLAGWLDPKGGGEERRLGKPSESEQAGVSVRVDDSPGWGNLSGRPHDYDQAKVQELYADALEAWRKNPIAWRIIAITTDYVVGDKVELSSSNRNLTRFIDQFWNHPKNRMYLRLEAMSDELARSGDLFVLLFRNEVDGMSYVRFVTKDRIAKVETLPNDWETELAYYEIQDGGEPKRWVSPSHPEAANERAIMLHYSVNRPLGALLGEGDLTTMIPWLQRYSRMLEDRVRLHWAVRAFLWLVTVPAQKVKEKQEQYRLPPDAGSIIVKDESEKWEVYSPSLNGADARHDMSAVRGMVDSGAGYPPHWRGEAADANLATATAMQAPAERHLLRRQKYFVFMLEDIVYRAYQRGVEPGLLRRLPTDDYEQLFTVAMPDISRTDKESLARSARDVSLALETLAGLLPGRSELLNKTALRVGLKFAGEPVGEDELDMMLDQAAAASDQEKDLNAKGAKGTKEEEEQEKGGHEDAEAKSD